MDDKPKRGIVTLTDEQRAKIVEFWNSRPKDPPSIMEITQYIFPGKDGRSFEGVAIKKFLAEKSIKPKTLSAYEPKIPQVVLTKEQEEFIANNASSMNFLEIARTLFNNPDLENQSAESRRVLEYIKTLPNQLSCKTEASKPAENEYRPPKTFDQTLARINKYIPEKINPAKMSERQKRDVRATQGFLNTYRVISTVNSFEEQTDRDLFEHSLISFIHDKYDLVAEEFDTYINWAQDIVNSNSSQRRLNKLNVLFFQCAEDSDGARASGSIAEAIDSLSKEISENKKRQKDYLKILSGERSRKKNQLMAENASVMTLVEAWKEEKLRKKMIELAQRRQMQIGEEFKKLESMDSIKAAIFGTTLDETLYGM